ASTGAFDDCSLFAARASILAALDRAPSGVSAIASGSRIPSPLAVPAPAAPPAAALGAPDALDKPAAPTGTVGSNSGCPAAPFDPGEISSEWCDAYSAVDKNSPVSAAGCVRPAIACGPCRAAGESWLVAACSASQNSPASA